MGVESVFIIFIVIRVWKVLGILYSFVGRSDSRGYYDVFAFFIGFRFGEFGRVDRRLGVLS